MHSKIASDHNDHYTTPVMQKIFFVFVPLEITLDVQSPRLLPDHCKDSDLDLSKSAHR
jgi:hypothetical protein